jgi:hypothetical protein
MTEKQLESRRAIEALRTGVPNREAVRALGCSQFHIEEKFLGRLQNRQHGGMLIAGDFGTGKSHLLEYLHHAALERGFVSSKIVIGKETPLYDPVKLYRAAIDAAKMPDKKGRALHEVVQTLNENSPAYLAFRERLNSDAAGFDVRFAATFYIYEQVRMRDLELRDRMISFWSGHKLNQSDIKSSLRQIGEAASYRFNKISEKDLALHRFRFAAELMTVAGYAGWVVLVDEVELIGRYSLLQRAKSYVEAARWMGALKNEPPLPLIAVFTLTPDFGRAVLEEKNDLEKIRARLEARGAEGDRLMASQADRGMKELLKPVLLKRIDRDGIRDVGEKLREIHATAYQWTPPAAQPDGEFLTSGRTRTFIRALINQMDLARLYPSCHAETESRELQPSTAEDKDLEAPGETEDDNSFNGRE